MPSCRTVNAYSSDRRPRAEDPLFVPSVSPDSAATTTRPTCVRSTTFSAIAASAGRSTTPSRPCSTTCCRVPPSPSLGMPWSGCFARRTVHTATFLAGRLGASRRLPKERLGKLLSDLAALIAPGNARLVAALAVDTKKVSRRARPGCLERAAAPLDPLLLRPFALLTDESPTAREDTDGGLAAILPGITEEILAQDLLEKATKDLGKSRSLKPPPGTRKAHRPSAPLVLMADRLHDQCA